MFGLFLYKTSKEVSITPMVLVTLAILEWREILEGMKVVFKENSLYWLHVTVHL
jgi:hypothetical protein